MYEIQCNKSNSNSLSEELTEWMNYVWSRQWGELHQTQAWQGLEMLMIWQNLHYDDGQLWALSYGFEEEQITPFNVNSSWFHLFSAYFY